VRRIASMDMTLLCVADAIPHALLIHTFEVRLMFPLNPDRSLHNRPREPEVTTRLRSQSLDDSYPAGRVLTGWGTLVTITSGEARRVTARPAQALLARFELSICSGAKRSLSQDRSCFRRPAAVDPHGRWGRRRLGGRAASAAFVGCASECLVTKTCIAKPVPMPRKDKSLTSRELIDAS
jgi:hypothetical protein